MRVCGRTGPDRVFGWRSGKQVVLIVRRQRLTCRDLRDRRPSLGAPWRDRHWRKSWQRVRRQERLRGQVTEPQLGHCGLASHRKALDSVQYRFVRIASVRKRCLKSNLKQTAEARDMLASVERRGYRQPCQLHLFTIKLTKANSNWLARRRRFRRKLDRLISFGRLKADRLALAKGDQKGFERTRLLHDLGQRRRHSWRRTSFNKGSECGGIHSSASGQE